MPINILNENTPNNNTVNDEKILLDRLSNSINNFNALPFPNFIENTIQEPIQEIIQEPIQEPIQEHNEETLTK